MVAGKLIRFLAFQKRNNIVQISKIVYIAHIFHVMIKFFVALKVSFVYKALFRNMVRHIIRAPVNRNTASKKTVKDLFRYIPRNIPGIFIAYRKLILLQNGSFKINSPSIQRKPERKKLCQKWNVIIQFSRPFSAYQLVPVPTNTVQIKIFRMVFFKPSYRFQAFRINFERMFST